MRIRAIIACPGCDRAGGADAAGRPRPRPSGTRRWSSTSRRTRSTPASTPRWRARSTRARASTCTWSRRRPRPTRSSCSRPGAPTSPSSTSTTSRSRASAAKDIVGIMAIVERPLAAVIAAPSIHTPARAGRQDGRRHRRAERHRGAALDRRGRRRRSGQGQDGHDRLQRRPGAAVGPRRRRDRVLERRGRHAPAAPTAAFTSSASTSTAPRPTPSWSCARPPEPQRGPEPGARGRSGRSSAATG